MKHGKRVLAVESEKSLSDVPADEREKIAYQGSWHGRVDLFHAFGG
ncbi:MAG: hypothetical protein IPL71_24790 [Anaerolineales bacterium]|nr:hypothetical protein [Anaerolineales bacterium]